MSEVRLLKLDVAQFKQLTAYFIILVENAAGS